MKLNNLKPAEGSTHSRRRIGRGPGSGLGGTSTRGHKGAKARSGYKRKIGFNFQFCFKFTVTENLYKLLAVCEASSLKFLNTDFSKVLCFSKSLKS